MNIINNKQFNWSKVEDAIKSNIEKEFCYINVSKITNLEGALKNGATSLNLSIDKLVTGVLRDRLCIIHINCLDLLCCKDSEKLYKYNKKAKALFEFLKEIGFELNAEIHLVKNSYSFNGLRKDKSVSYNTNLEDVFSVFKDKGFNVENDSLSTVFSGDLKELLASVVDALARPIINSIILDMTEVRKMIDEIIEKLSRSVANIEEIFVKEELTA
ncbi:hypothetical protein [Priestia aryabhattai]